MRTPIPTEQFKFIWKYKVEIEDLAQGVVDKLIEGHHYSELSETKLKSVIKKHLHKIYSEEMKKGTAISKASANSVNDYLKVFEDVENKVVLAAYEIAATSLDDLHDLKNFYSNL